MRFANVSGFFQRAIKSIWRGVLHREKERFFPTGQMHKPRFQFTLHGFVCPRGTISIICEPPKKSAPQLAAACRPPVLLKVWNLPLPMTLTNFKEHHRAQGKVGDGRRPDCIPRRCYTCFLSQPKIPNRLTNSGTHPGNQFSDQFPNKFWRS